MRTFTDYLNIDNADQFIEYEIQFEASDSFVKMLRSLKLESREPINIVRRENRIYVQTSKSMHKRINAMWRI